MAGEDWTSTLLVLLILSSFLLNFTDIPQRIQLWRWSSYIRKRIIQLFEIEQDARRKAVKYLSEQGLKDPGKAIDDFVDNYFLISPVSLEPTDIIKRLRHLIRERNRSVKAYVKEVFPDASEDVRQNAEVMFEIVSVLVLINKIVKHYFQLGLKYSNWILMMQLALEMPMIVRLAKIYDDAMDSFASGTPVGDGAGPLAVRYLLSFDVPEREVAEETLVLEGTVEGRKVLAIKAKGPGSSVGYPGEALRKVVEEVGRVSAIITVDAALKLESEETGEVSYGVGAAIGDPGPEKIEMERVAAEKGVPLYAVVIKMSEEDAITTMSEEIVKGVKKAVDIIKEIIRKLPPEEPVIVVGVGNTIGIR